MPKARKNVSMPNVRASSGTIGTTSLPSSLSRISAASTRTSTIVVEAARSPEPARNSANASEDGGIDRGIPNPPLRHETAQRAAALLQVADLDAVRAGPIERSSRHVLI